MIIGVFVLIGQANAFDDSLKTDSLSQVANTVQADSLVSQEVIVSDTVILDPTPYSASIDTSLINAYRTENFTPQPKRSPSMTMLKSVAFPGWGQYANKKYLKSGIIFAIESYFIYKAIDFGMKAKDSRAYWKSLPDSLVSEKAAAFRLYTDDRDNRNSNIWYTVIVTFLSMIDAYVDAHLQDFPKPAKPADKLSLELGNGADLQLSVVYRF